MLAKARNLAWVLETLENQQVIAYPTEAVFGLGCDPDSRDAVYRLLNLKQRSWEKGLILIAAYYEQLLPYVDDLRLLNKHREQIFASWPGPITWIMPAHTQTPTWLTGCFSTIAVRVSAHPVVQQLCLAYGKPVVSSSANLSGLTPCRTANEVRAQFGETFPLLEGAVGCRRHPSEIRDALSGQIVRMG